MVLFIIVFIMEVVFEFGDEIWPFKWKIHVTLMWALYMYNNCKNYYAEQGSFNIEVIIDAWITALCNNYLLVHSGFLELSASVMFQPLMWTSPLLSIRKQTQERMIKTDFYVCLF